MSGCPIIPPPTEADHFALCHTGELPLTIGQLKANGCKVDLSGNKGFTLSSDISAVMDAAKLDFSDCCLSGAALPIIPPQKPIRKPIQKPIQRTNSPVE